MLPYTNPFLYGSRVPRVAHYSIEVHMYHSVDEIDRLVPHPLSLQIFPDSYSMSVAQS